jgi:DNA recombination protein RmuC
MNKEYISYINQLYNTPITNNNIPVTFEDLQSLKRDKFNNELNQKKEEFQELFQKKIPEILNFKEEIDKPIHEMEDLISQTIAQRSFDIEQINKTLPPPKLDENSIQKKQISWEDEPSLKNKLSSIETKLDIIRATVEEKLEKTLSERLGQSFETVGKQLIEVQKGLGEMQTIATDVGGLKKVLSNVKLRGGVGEVQLAAAGLGRPRAEVTDGVAIDPRDRVARDDDP